MLASKSFYSHRRTSRSKRSLQSASASNRSSTTRRSSSITLTLSPLPIAQTCQDLPNKSTEAKMVLEPTVCRRGVQTSPSAKPVGIKARNLHLPGPRFFSTRRPPSTSKKETPSTTNWTTSMTNQTRAAAVRTL